jgi:hypothetical protein
MNGNSEFDAVVRLLRPLDAEPASLSTVDVARAMAVGGRRRRARRAAAVGLAAAVTALVLVGLSVTFGGDQAARPGPEVTTAPPEPTTCDGSRLATPEGTTQSSITGADPSGRYFAGRYSASGVIHTAIWDDGKPTNTPVDGAHGELTDVNATGVAVGYEYENWQAFPYIYRDGTVTKLAERGIAYAVNEAGVVVGTDGAEVHAIGRHAVLWRTPSSAPVRLPVPPDATGSEARDVDEDGTIVGAVWFERGRQVPYVWMPDGTHRALLPPGGSGSSMTGQAVTVRGGFAVAVYNDPPFGVVRWNLRTGEMRAYEDLLGGWASGNRYGWIVGADLSKRGVFIGERERLMLPGPAGALAHGARTVSDDGLTIGGHADDGEGVWAMVWRCR